MVANNAAKIRSIMGFACFGALAGASSRTPFKDSHHGNSETIQYHAMDRDKTLDSTFHEILTR